MNPANQTPVFQPLYMQIKGMITQRLESREWGPGDALPSETELAARFKVSQGTVRKAMDALSDENILIRRQGKGTFVATHTEERSSFVRFLRIRRADGSGAHPKSLLIDLQRSRASAEIARILNLRAGEAVIVMTRLLTFDNEPTVLDEITLAAGMFKGFTRERYEAFQGSVYGFFEKEFSVPMLRATEQIKAVAADPRTAEMLKVGIGTPLLAVERTAYTYGDKPVEFRRGLCTTRNAFYSNDLF